MATAAIETEPHENLSDVEQCFLCTEIFKDPKILPCLHSFCLHCLEKYGKDESQGDQMACPICKNEFPIPAGGMSNLPDNSLTAKVAEIENSKASTAKEGICDPWSEVEALDEISCVDCVQTPESQPLSAQESDLNSNYCDLHPKELLQMYCFEDNVAVCLVCCVESHHSHRCANVDEAAGEFVERLKEDSKTVATRLTECEEVGQKLQKYEKDLKEEIPEVEAQIRGRGFQLKTLIDDHTEILIRKLKSVAERNIKSFESIKQDVNRFKAMIDSYSRKSEALLSQGSFLAICRDADLLHAKANELENLPINFDGNCLRCDAVAFQPSGFENALEQCNSCNAVGQVTVTESRDRMIQFEVDSSRRQLLKMKSAFNTGFSTVRASGIPRDVSKDMISMYFGNGKLSGGGKHTVLEHHVDEGKAVIKFDNPEDALNVCKRRHVLCGAVLWISTFEMLLDGIRGCVTEAKKGRSGHQGNPFFNRIF